MRALEALALDQVAFVGFSWGATVGVHLAAASPERVRALVLLDGGYRDPHDEPDFADRGLGEVEA